MQNKLITTSDLALSLISYWAIFSESDIFVKVLYVKLSNLSRIRHRELWSTIFDNSNLEEDTLVRGRGEDIFLGDCKFYWGIDDSSYWKSSRSIDIADFPCISSVLSRSSLPWSREMIQTSVLSFWATTRRPQIILDFCHILTYHFFTSQFKTASYGSHQLQSLLDDPDWASTRRQVPGHRLHSPLTKSIYWWGVSFYLKVIDYWYLDINWNRLLPFYINSKIVSIVSTRAFSTPRDIVRTSENSTRRKRSQRSDVFDHDHSLSETIPETRLYKWSSGNLLSRGLDAVSVAFIRVRSL